MYVQYVNFEFNIKQKRDISKLWLHLHFLIYEKVFILFMVLLSLVLPYFWRQFSGFSVFRDIVIYNSKNLKGEFFSFSFNVRYSSLLYLPPLRFHCVGGCSDRKAKMLAISSHVSWLVYLHLQSPALTLKVLSSHLNWGARLDSFDPLLNRR